MGTPTEGLTKCAEEVLAQFKLAQQILNSESKKRKELRRKVIRTNAAQQIIQDIAKAVQENVHTGIARIVTRCIQAVYQDDPAGPYEFQIKFDRKRGKTEARLVFIRDGEEFQPMDESGGGVIDVAAFALRLACIIMEKPRRRRIMFLDEPFRFVDAEKRPALVRLLHDLTRELDFQLVQTTHINELKIGQVIEL